jgi:VWFA-related protein
MRAHLVLLTSFLLTLHLRSQTPAPPTTLQAGTQLVLVDVTVEDKRGNPIHGLTRNDFRLTDNHQPQTLRNFDEHTAPTVPPNAPSFHLPIGTFTDYSPVPPSPALNILLFDALNTPTKDQDFVRSQLHQFVQHAPPSARIAIFGLADRITVLQGFTSDPALLKAAVDGKLKTHSSTLLADPEGYGASANQSASDIVTNSGFPSQALAGVSQFEGQINTAQTQGRIQMTLDAFDSLAHYLASFPGRKNLLWFSGSFPINILPDPTLDDPFANARFNEDEFLETTRLLTRAQVAVYPIDARGLFNPHIYSGANPGHSHAGNPSGMSKDIFNFFQSQADENRTMDQLATNTGGRATYDTDNLAAAVARDLTAGENFYTLAYTPTTAPPDGKYHVIQLELTPEAAAAHPGLHLAYRRGYFADPPAKSSAAKSPAVSPVASPPSPDPPSDTLPTLTYLRAAMDRGAPAPQDVIFKVRAIPASSSAETALAPGNQIDPTIPANGPFRRVSLDFATLPAAATLTSTPDGLRSGSLQFLALLYTPEGRLLNVVTQTLYIHLQPADFDRFTRSSIPFHLEVSIPVPTPAKSSPPSETFLRLGVLDVPSHRIGVLELPSSVIFSLPAAAPTH